MYGFLSWLTSKLFGTLLIESGASLHPTTQTRVKGVRYRNNSWNYIDDFCNIQSSNKGKGDWQLTRLRLMWPSVQWGLSSSHLCLLAHSGWTCSSHPRSGYQLSPHGPNNQVLVVKCSGRYHRILGTSACTLFLNVSCSTLGGLTSYLRLTVVGG